MAVVVLGKKITAAAAGAVMVLTAVVAIGKTAASASSIVPTTSLTLDGVTLTVGAADLPSTEFTAAEPGDSSQSATDSTDNPYSAISLTAVPFGYDDPVEDLGTATASSASTWLTELSTTRVTGEGGVAVGTPTANLFGQTVTGIESRVSLSPDGGAPQSIVIDEWVVSAGSRLWVVRAESVAGPDAFVPSVVVTSANVNAPTTIDDTGSGYHVQSSVPAAGSTLPTPSWWSGTCDKGNDPGSYELGTTTYRGVMACGPRHRDRNGTEPWVYIGGWGEKEWECVELVMRYMYQAGYVTHGYQANGNQVVAHYNGTKMVRESNGKAGVSPQPGDVVSMGFDTTDGHTAIVIANHVNTSTGDGTIEILQENSSASGVGTMDVSDWRVQSTVGTGVTWLHDPTATPPPGTGQKPTNDYNGDGLTDLALRRPGTVVPDGNGFMVGQGTYLLQTTGGAAITGNGTLDSVFGESAVVPVPGDYNGDGKTDLALWEANVGDTNGTWLLHTTSGAAITGNGFLWGIPGDIPVPGDYNGDGKSDLVTWRPSTGMWYMRTVTGAAIAGTGTHFGQAGDIPVPGDYNGDGIADFALFRPSTGQWLIETTAGVTIPDFASTTGYGHPGDIPVPGDYNGDGVSDIALWRPSNGEWFLRTTAGGVITGDDFLWGVAGDYPVPGDYNGDGESDLATYRPSTGGWFFRTTSGRTITGTGSDFGVPGDVPMASLAFENIPPG
jgi:CHAP domain